MSAYRSAPAADPSLTLACAACGAFAEVRRGDDAFRCATCGREQPVLRGEVDFDENPASPRATAYTQGSYDELAPFAKSVGVAARCALVKVECDGLSCEVSLGIESGRVTGLGLWVSSPGFPAIKLRRETSAEVRAKRKGVTHEVQTGDATFDAFVYVESDHADDDVAPVLAAPAVRAAIVQLLHTGSEAVTLSPSGVHVHVPGPLTAFHPDQIRVRLAALRAIAGAPRAIAPRPASKDRWGLVAAGVMLGSIVFGPILLTVVWCNAPTVSLRPLLVGLIAGLLLALASQPLLSRKLRGRWDSHQSLLIGRAASVLCLPMLAISALVGGNALFDRSPERVYELTVASVSYEKNDSNDPVSKVTVRGRSGAAAAIVELELELDDPERAAAPGQRVTVGIKRGAFGWAWRTSPAGVYAGKRVLVEK